MYSFITLQSLYILFRKLHQQETYQKKIGGTGNDSYDDLYLGGYQCGYDAALSDSKWDDLWAFIQSGMAAIANTSGDNDGLNWYNNGIKQGYLDGCKYKQK